MSDPYEPNMRFGECPQINLTGSNLIGTATDCLHFSNVFTLSGYETVNDKILLEMNEKVRAAQKEREEKARNPPQPSNPPLQALAPNVSNIARNLPKPPLKPSVSFKLAIPRSSSVRQLPRQSQHQQSPAGATNAHKTTNNVMSTSASIQARLQDLARITRSPPGTRYSTAHNKEFAQSAPLTSSPLSKRQTDGEESPSKRRRAPCGAAIGITASPSKSLESLSIGSNANRLEGVSIARSRDRQRRDLQTSPRRRLPVPRNVEKPASTLMNVSPPPLMPGSFPRSPQEQAQAQSGLHQQQQHSQLQPQSQLHSPHQRQQLHHDNMRQEPGKRNFSSPLPRRLDSSNKLAIPRSQSTRAVPRSVSFQSVPDVQAPRSLAAPTDRIPSYARPTQAALRRSQSNQHVAIDKVRRQ